MIKSLTFSTKSNNYAGFYSTFLVAYPGRDNNPGRAKNGQPGYDWRGNGFRQIPAGIKAGPSAGHPLCRTDIQKDQHTEPVGGNGVPGGNSRPGKRVFQKHAA